jgi:NADH-quinone oxidoreductase subunit M
MVILGAVQQSFWLGMGAATALIFGAAYTLWMVKRVYLGPVANEQVRSLTDINSREFLMLTLLALAVLGMGLDPKPMTDTMGVSVNELLRLATVSKLGH